MKKLFFAGLALIYVLTGYSQSAEKNLQTRNQSGFHGVRVSGGIDLYISSGKESVAVTAANNEIRDHMITEVVNGILLIHLEENWQPDLSNPRMKAYVTVSSLDDLEASGGGDIYITNELKTDKLTVHLSGGGNMEGKINAHQLSIRQSGGSNVKLTGNVNNLEVNASGGGNLEGFGLVTEYASINASGGSNSELTVNKELRVMTSGGSDINYKGTAKVLEVKTSGGGSLNHKD